MEKSTLGQNTLLTDRRQKEHHVVREQGQLFCTKLIRLIKSGKIFSAEHAQTQEAAEDLATWVNEYLTDNEQDFLQLQFTEHNIFLDGDLIAVEERGNTRAQLLRDSFLTRYVNVIECKQGITSREFVDLIIALYSDEERLNKFTLTHLSLLLIGINESADGFTADERRAIIELYAALLVRTRSYFNRIRARTNPTAKHIKRLLQRITDHIDGRADAFIGLINMKLVTGRDFIHATNCAIYSIILANEAGLNKLDVVRCGMTAIAQDVDKLDNSYQTEAMDMGDQVHYQTNLTSVVTLTQTGSQDVLSALRLVTNYERGFPYNRPLPTSWYEDGLPPHLLTRIVEIARDYDILTQGFESLEPLKPDMGLQALMMKMGSHYDPALVKLFINALGIFPVGSQVRLSDGRCGLVIRSASTRTRDGISQASRPTVRLLDGSAEIINLSSSRHSRLYVERLLGDDEIQERPGALLLF